MTDIKFPFNMMVFPTGPICNLDCDYCYYSDKIFLYPGIKDFKIKKELLEEYIKQYIETQPGPVVSFGWQGGEPTLRGLDFFREVIELQEKYIPEGWRYQNNLQTNGVLLTDEWCEFLRENNFLVGISIDGPAKMHDVYRKDKKGDPSFTKVLQGLHFLQEHNVEYNVLCVVNNVNSQYPLEVYNFFKNEGIKYVQFIPLVEKRSEDKVSYRTVSARDYGRFLISIFDEYIYNDLGEISIQIFEECIAAWAGYESNLCVFSETCGRALVMEHNGDIYPCDHFVFTGYKLGNIQKIHIGNLIDSPQQKKFGQIKKKTLPEVCRRCDFLFICNGGCPKNRISKTKDGNKGLSFLCAGYKQFFKYIDPYMQEIVKMVKLRQIPSVIKIYIQSLHDSIWKSVGRNDP